MADGVPVAVKIMSSLGRGREFCASVSLPSILAYLRSGSIEMAAALDVRKFSFPG